MKENEVRYFFLWLPSKKIILGWLCLTLLLSKQLPLPDSLLLGSRSLFFPSPLAQRQLIAPQLPLVVTAVPSVVSLTYTSVKLLIKKISLNNPNLSMLSIFFWDSDRHLSKSSHKCTLFQNQSHLEPVVDKTRMPIITA